MNNQNSQKGNTFLIIAIIVGVVAIGITGFASWKYFGGGSELEKETQPSYLPKQEKTVPEMKEQEEIKKEEIISSKKVDEMADWKICKNEEYGFEIKYPKNWPVSEKEEKYGDERRYLIGLNQINGQFTFDSYIVEVLDSGNQTSQQFINSYYGEMEGGISNIKNDIINGQSVVKFFMTKAGVSPAGSAFILFKNNSTIVTVSNIKQGVANEIMNDKILNQIASTFKFIETNEISNSVKILSPNGGEKWKIGNSYLIRWNSVGSIPQVKIYLVPVNSNAGIRYISYGPIANTNSYTYAIPYCGPGHECSSNFEIPKGEYYIRITDSKGVVSDQSDASFSIISN